MGQDSRETWAKRVERWKESGLTASEYAGEIGVRADTLKWWKWRLGSESRGAAAVASKPAKRKHHEPNGTTAAASPMTFVEVSAPTRRDPFELLLQCGRTIRVPNDFDAAALARLLVVVEHRT